MEEEHARKKVEGGVNSTITSRNKNTRGGKVSVIVKSNESVRMY